MKAAVLEGWRKISVKEIEPPALGQGEALLKTSLAGICGSDVHIFNGTNPIAVPPVVQGHEFMGELVSRDGPLPDGLKIGDRAVVHPLVSCGHCSACSRSLDHVCEALTVIGVNRHGGFAEYVRVPSEKLIPVPGAMPDEVAVLAEPFAVGYHACRRAGLQVGENVLVVGSGPIGLYGALVARKLGAAVVVVSEPRAERRLLAARFGLEVADPTNPHCQDDLKSRNKGHGFNVVIETSGMPEGINFAIEASAVAGRIASLGFPSSGMADYNVTRGIVKEISFIGSRVYPFDEFRNTVSLLHDLWTSREIDFADIIADIRRLSDVERSISDVAKGRETGKILIRP